MAILYFVWQVVSPYVALVLVVLLVFVWLAIVLAPWGLGWLVGAVCQVSSGREASIGMRRVSNSVFCLLLCVSLELTFMYCLDFPWQNVRQTFPEAMDRERIARDAFNIM